MVGASGMPNYKFTVRYDGREFFGWQRHGDKATVQGALESVLEAFAGCPVRINGSGRTDRGAHATAQVFSCELPRDDTTPPPLDALNARLPSTIELLDCRLVASDFHARQSAIGKTYRYEILNARECPPAQTGRVWHIPAPLDSPAMAAACEPLVGRHDFASFATRPNFKQKSTTRELRRASCAAHDSQITLVFEADGFLYKMVRNLVRAIVKVGEGRTRPEAIATILAARDRKAAPGTAPASGLYLDAVHYPEPHVG